MNLSSATYAIQKVEKGLAWLKESGPTHGLDYTRIDPRTVHVLDPFRCPLAQASMLTYSGALRQIFYRPGQDFWSHSVDWPQEHGFDVSYGGRDFQQEDVFLSHAWRLALYADQAMRTDAAGERAA